MKIAFLHALPFDGRMWAPQIDAFAEHETHAPTLYVLGSSFDDWALGVLQAVPGRFVAVLTFSSRAPSARYNPREP